MPGYGTQSATARWQRADKTTVSGASRSSTIRLAQRSHGLNVTLSRTTEGRVEPGLFYSCIDGLISAFPPTIRVEFSALLLPRIHFCQRLRADSLWTLSISSGDFVNPGQIWGNLHVDCILVHSAGFVIGEDPRGVNIPSLGVFDGQSAARVTKANVFLKPAGLGAEHAVIHRWHEIVSSIFSCTGRVVDQGHYEVFERRGEV